ncbi:inositol transporter [Schistosoma mansoni]|uniref:inositol transporter n=1 Tax=Schistosoma mansoni TaxID=6183 RepID=UPI0001A63B92|nr:inositol transporter [Schistosoma mansoni]|eukprot:XP_018649694.1 inositol transporter [Schistosoma mansoni]
MNLNVLDIIVLVIYFAALLGTGIYALFASRRGTVTGYFLAGRFMTWLPVGASLFASNIGSEHFIGLAGSGAAAGIAVGAFELNASILLQLLGWVFLPVYIASGVFTLPEYMKKRYGGERIHMYLALLSLILYIFTKISVNLYSGSLFLTEALKWNTWVSIVLLLFLTGLITVTGGLAAVLYTDTLQFFVMIIGALILAIISYINAGGFGGVLSSYGRAIAPINISSSTDSDLIISLANVLNTTNYTSLTQLASSPDVPSSLKCSLPPENAFVLLRGINDPEMPWLGFLLGQTPASIWYWCTDQMMVQRVLAAKSLSHAQGATLMAGLIKQLPLFLIVIPGMISRILFPDVIGCKPGPDCYRICGQKSGCSNLAYPKLVINIMPSGLRGLMLAVMLAALISDLTSIFNSASTLFTVDVYMKIRKKAKNMEIMVVSRIFVIVLILLSIAWIPVIQEFQGSQLYIYIQGVSAYLAPPVASVYLCAILNKRTTERGAFYGLMYGLITGLIRLILTIIYHEPVCGEEDNRPWIIKDIHYMYFALFSFITCGLIVCLLSLTEKRLTNEQLYHNYSTNQKHTSQSSSWYKILKNICLWFCGCADHPCSNIDIKNHCQCNCLQRLCNQFTTHFHSNHHHSHEKIYIITSNDIQLIEDKSIFNDDQHQLNTVDDYYKQPINSLKQNSNIKLGLYIGLILTIILSIFGFIFFSVYFDSIQIGPLPVHINDWIMISNETLKNALNTLNHHGLITIQ